MTADELREHRIAKARKQGDIAALAILEGGHRFVPDPAPVRFVVKALAPLPPCNLWHDHDASERCLDLTGRTIRVAA